VSFFANLETSRSARSMVLPVPDTSLLDLKVNGVHMDRKPMRKLNNINTSMARVNLVLPKRVWT